MGDILCNLGIHRHVWVGGGLFDDAMECRVCGRDKYPENFGIAIFTEPRPIDINGCYLPRLKETRAQKESK